MPSLSGFPIYIDTYIHACTYKHIALAKQQ